MKIYGTVAASVLVLKLIFSGAGVCRAQDAGTSAASMPDPTAPKIMLQVSADGDYRWELDHDDMGRITAAMGIKQVPTSPGHHEITARQPNGKTSFIKNTTMLRAFWHRQVVDSRARNSSAGGGEAWH